MSRYDWEETTRGSHVIWQASVCVRVRVKRCGIVTQTSRSLAFEAISISRCLTFATTKSGKGSIRSDAGIWVKWVVGLGVTYF